MYSYILIKVLIHLLFTSTDETLDENYMSTFHTQLVQSMFVLSLPLLYWVLYSHIQCLHVDVSHINIACVCPLLTIPDLPPCFCKVLFTKFCTATFDAYVSTSSHRVSQWQLAVQVLWQIVGARTVQLTIVQVPPWASPQGSLWLAQVCLKQRIYTHKGVRQDLHVSVSHAASMVNVCMVLTFTEFFAATFNAYMSMFHTLT